MTAGEEKNFIWRALTFAATLVALATCGIAETDRFAAFGASSHIEELGAADGPGLCPGASHDLCKAKLFVLPVVFTLARHGVLVDEPETNSEDGRPLCRHSYPVGSRAPPASMIS